MHKLVSVARIIGNIKKFPNFHKMLSVGVKHPNIVCDGCSKAGIAGIRFRCAQCTNYDLCATCYGSDIHDLEHPFVRYQTTNSVG